VGRLPHDPLWRVTHPAHDAAIVEHRDQAAWFEAPFLPINAPTAPGQTPAPRVLADGRNALSHMLYASSALAQLGYPDLDVLS